MKPCARLAVFLSVLFFAFGGSVHAEQWSLAEDREHAPAAQRNRIIKWCKLDGSHERYASANIRLKGYEPCGTISVPVTCDASGKRMIGTDKDRPRGHRDCGIGPRITIFNYSDHDTIDRSGQAQSPEEITAMSSTEQEEMARELDAAAKDYGKEFEQAVTTLLKELLPVMPRPASRGKTPRNLEESLRMLDRDTRKSLEELLRKTR